MVAWTCFLLLVPGTLRAVRRRHAVLRVPTRLAVKPDAGANRPVDPFDESLQSLGFPQSTQESIRKKLAEAGLSSSLELAHLARDFVDRPEVFSSLLQSDFGFSALMAHQTRAAVMIMLDKETSLVKDTETSPLIEHNGIDLTTDGEHITARKKALDVSSTVLEPVSDIPDSTDSSKVEQKATYKSVIVNEEAKKRRGRSSSSTQKNDYGLPSDYRERFPLLATELDDFYTFMTQPTPSSQDQPIRPATADVYLRHARLFLGWYITQNDTTIEGERGVDNDLSLYSIVASKEKESAASILDFILWLRSTRNISVSYEANLLRGLTKLLKFRFANESQSDPSYGEKSFDDIPLIREIRKLHRDANKRQSLSSRSSDEERKWLPWSEYLQVIRSLKKDLFRLIVDYQNKYGGTNNQKPNTAAVSAQRKIATVYQYYLILAFFASVPDRQRTIRELELGKSFVKDENLGVYVIRHGPEDYKTGSTYGERPPLPISQELVPAIDDFIERWRPCLVPSTDFLFVQPRTGKPMTQDSVYQVVARSCFKYTGKKTNPHLLRDMIVTHVRESDASEKELEALALFMGHSIQMQRTSYDRRTLTKKVAPAVELLQSVNNKIKTIE